MDYGLIAVDVLNSVVSPTPDVGLIGAAGITARSVAKEAAEGAGSAAAKAGAAAIDANKFAHIFGNAQHDLGALVRKIGSQEATFTAVQGATQAAVKGQGLSGVFQTTVTVAGQNVVVKGNLIDDIARIGTFLIP